MISVIITSNVLMINISLQKHKVQFKTILIRGSSNIIRIILIPLYIESMNCHIFKEIEKRES